MSCLRILVRHNHYTPLITWLSKNLSEGKSTSSSTQVALASHLNSIGTIEWLENGAHSLNRTD